MEFRALCKAINVNQFDLIQIMGLKRWQVQLLYRNINRLSSEESLKVKEFLIHKAKMEQIKINNIIADIEEGFTPKNFKNSK